MQKISLINYKKSTTVGYMAYKQVKEGDTVFYIIGNYVRSGNVIDIEMHGSEYTFAIDSYGACEGNFRIASSMLGICVFTDEQEAKKYADDPDYQGGFHASC